MPHIISVACCSVVYLAMPIRREGPWFIKLNRNESITKQLTNSGRSSVYVLLKYSDELSYAEDNWRDSTFRRDTAETARSIWAAVLDARRSLDWAVYRLKWAKGFVDGQVYVQLRCGDKANPTWYWCCSERGSCEWRSLQHGITKSRKRKRALAPLQK